MKARISSVWLGPRVSIVISSTAPLAGHARAFGQQFLLRQQSERGFFYGSFVDQYNVIDKFPAQIHSDVADIMDRDAFGQSRTAASGPSAS